MSGRDHDSSIHRVHRWFADRLEPFRPADGPPPDSLWPFLRWVLAGTSREVWIAVAASISVGVTSIVGFYLIGWVIDAAQAAGPGFIAERWDILVLLAVFYILIWPLSLVANAAFNSLTLGPNLYALTLSRINRHTLGQSLSFFDNDFAGRIAQKMQQTARAITDVILESTNILGNAVAAVASAIVMLAFVHPLLGAVVAIWVTCYGVLIRWYIPKIRVRSQKRAARRAMVTGQVVDTITNITTVKLFAHGTHEDEATQDALWNYREAGIGWASTVVTFRLIIFTLAGMLPAVLIGVALWLWSLGVATAGDVATAGLVSTRLSTMTGWVSFAALGIFTNIGEIEDGIRTLSPPHSVADPARPRDPIRAQGEIVFDDVSFGYGQKNAALDRFSLTIQPGEKVALVGQSGAGKTTVVSLLLRLYDVERGAIRLDGRDIREMTQDGLRRQIAVVRQETAMFNRSALDNIRYGTPEASEADVIRAAERAAAHEFIPRLRDFRGREGYHAFLGERGVKLSGGQRQRIALARAILKDAPVLVLDEATSALDSEVEAEIQEGLQEVMRGKTVLAIAHRLSTIAAMDRVIVLEEGRIVETGNHETLLAKGGLYARFWTRQSGGFLGTEAAE